MARPHGETMRRKIGVMYFHEEAESPIYTSGTTPHLVVGSEPRLPGPPPLAGAAAAHFAAWLTLRGPWRVHLSSK